MEEKRDPFDGDYIGNIWGWKFSYIGLAIILFFSAIMWYRFATLDPAEDLQKEVPEQIDSLEVSNQNQN